MNPDVRFEFAADCQRLSRFYTSLPARMRDLDISPEQAAAALKLTAMTATLFEEILEALAKKRKKTRLATKPARKK